MSDANNASRILPIKYDLLSFTTQCMAISDEQFFQLTPKLYAAREELLEDVKLLRSGGDIPHNKQPLDVRCVDLPGELLREYDAFSSASIVGKILSRAEQLAAIVDRVVVIGIGGSFLGAQSLFRSCCHPFHNELSRQQRGGRPRIYFTGHNVDNDSVQALLDILQNEHDSTRWGLIVISKSGGTLEPIIAFRQFLNVLVAKCGKDKSMIRQLVVPVTGKDGELFQIARQLGCDPIFEVPENVGGRFSVLSPVGLLPCAVLGLDIIGLLRGADFITEYFKRERVTSNPVLDYAGVCHLSERLLNATIRVLSVWYEGLEAVGAWYDQLLSESLGKNGYGATPLTTVNTRDLHSRGQQHQQGRRDKLITNLIVDQVNRDPLPLGYSEYDLEKINDLSHLTLPQVMAAALVGTNRAYIDDHRPTANLHLPCVDELSLGQLYQMFMLATVIEGKLLGVNPFGQPGVENYKRNMNAILRSKD